MDDFVTRFGPSVRSQLLCVCAPVDLGMIDRCNRVLRGYLLGARGFMEARSQVGGDSRRALSRS
jgi:hypothetical protein